MLDRAVLKDLTFEAMIAKFDLVLYTNSYTSSA